MWIMVQNPGEIGVTNIRILGRSNKDESKIGRFGTGLKEAVCLLLRENISLVICSGEDVVKFSVEDGEVVYTVNDEHKAHMNLDINFGHHDWNDLWMAFREIFCNAIDEGIDMMHHEIVGDIEPKAGCTRVYIEGTMEALATYGQMPSRLLMLQKNYDPNEEIIEKVMPSPLKAYHKGVFITEFEDKPSLFDYNFKILSITESRTTDLFSVSCSFRFGPLRDFTKEQCRKVLFDTKHPQEELFEWSCMKDPYYKNENFGLCLKNEEVVVGYKEEYQEAIARGLEPILPPHRENYKYLIKSGCSGLSVGEEEEGYNIRKEVSVDSFDTLWETLNASHGKEKPNVLVYDRKSDQDPLGFVKENKIFISSEILGSRLEQRVVIEEIAHYISGYGDWSRGFQNFILDKLTEFVCPERV